jgi:hypothetical protein
MDNYSAMIEQTNIIINKYIGNKNYSKDLYQELSDKREEEGNSVRGLDEGITEFREIEKEIGVIENTNPRYCSKEDISTLEFTNYPKTKGSPSHQYLNVHRNLISEVELSDLSELMWRLNEMIETLEGYTDVESLEKCMKSMVRVVHRFRNTRDNEMSITKTHQSRDANTIHSW